MNKAELLKWVMEEETPAVAIQSKSNNDKSDPCQGAKTAVKSACKNVNKPVDDPEFPKACDDALDNLSRCMEERYG